jgi:hypothetical protein
MLADPTGEAATFAAVFATLYAAHQIADHWVQTQWQADTKGQPGWPGRLACALVLLATTYGATGLRPKPLELVIGLTVSAVSHYIADRRTPLIAIAERLGAIRFYALGIPRPGRDDNPCLGTGAYALDQAWHIGFLFIAAHWIA